jgi:hypothetical protein
MSLNDVDFTGRMQAGRDQAARDRHLGRNAGRPKYGKRPPLEDTAENRLHVELQRLQSEIRDRDNTIAVLRSGGDDCEPIDAGAEFDRLFTAAKSEGQACRPAPRSPQHSTTAARPRGTHTMTAKTSTQKDGSARAAALKLLASGEASPAEVATLAGVSRQLVNHWAQGVDWRKARNARLAKGWRQALRS